MSDMQLDKIKNSQKRFSIKRQETLNLIFERLIKN